MATAPPSKRSRLDSVAAYFRVYVHKKEDDDDEGSTHWYKLNVGGDLQLDREDDATRFSTTSQPFRSTVVGLDGKIYCLGGDDGVYWSTNAVTCFDTKNPDKGWCEVKGMRAPRLDPQALVINNKIFVFGGIDRNDYEEDDDFCGVEPDSWAECYDPNHDEWRTLSVVEIDGQPFDEKKDLGKLLNNDNRFRDPLNLRPSGCCYLAVKKSDNEVFIFSQKKGSFIYNITNRSLTTRIGFQIPIGFIKQCRPPMVIDNWIYCLDDSYGRGRRYNLADNSLEDCVCQFWKPHYTTPHASMMIPADHHVFRTDGLSGDAGIAKMIHVFRRDYFRVMKGSQMILCYVCASVPAGNEKFPKPKYKYFAVPSSATLLDCGILL